LTWRRPPLIGQDGAVSQRELVVLGSASQTPTRHRNHNGYLLRFDAEGILFDPGEGTQRQMIQAGRSASEITRICVTHFHGDHSLGLAGTIQRLSLDDVRHPVLVRGRHPVHPDTRRLDDVIIDAEQLEHCCLPGAEA